jgi:hypothetical protein
MSVVLVFATASLAVGVWLSLLNWRCFYVGFFLEKPVSSWIPFLGGILMFLGLFFLPGNPLSAFAWIVFFLDWGSIPGCVHAAYYYSKNHKR